MRLIYLFVFIATCFTTTALAKEKKTAPSRAIASSPQRYEAEMQGTDTIKTVRFNCFFSEVDPIQIPYGHYRSRYEENKDDANLKAKYESSLKAANAARVNSLKTFDALAERNFKLQAVIPLDTYGDQCSFVFTRQ